MGNLPPILSVVAPCHNEELVLPAFYKRMTAACEGMGQPFEMVLVDDGSADGTWKLMRQLCAQDPRIVAIKLSRNHGHQLALSAGLSICCGTRILIIDADLQDPPELLPEMSRLMDAGANVVYGQRRRRQGEGLLKRVTAALFYRIINRLADRPIPLDTGDFRLLSRRALDVLNAMPERHRFIRGMVSWLGFPQTPLLYDRDPRHAGETHYSFRKMLRLAIDAVTALSIRPLQFASWLALLIALLAAALLACCIIAWLRGITPPGWLWIIAAVAAFSSVQLFILGIMGEYLGRLYEQIKNRPLFIIQEIARGGTDGEKATAHSPHLAGENASPPQ